MKMIMCFYNVTIDSVIMEVLKKMNITFFSKLPKVFGQDGHSEPKFATRVWPGFNYGLLIMIEDKQKEEFLGAIRTIRKFYKKEGLEAIVLNFEETTQTEK